MNASVQVRNLVKQYGKNTVVNGVSFEIEQGETFALLGPNGAGKTVTIETLEGYRKPTGGEVRVLGEDPLKAGLEWRSRIGIVNQMLGSDNVLTTRELLGHAARVYPVHHDVDELLERLDLTKHAGKQIKKLSGGQKRRVDLALGIIGKPEVLFLDEPTTGLDPEVRRKLWDLIRSLQDEGTTILLTTHYLDEAEELSHRAGIILDGKILSIDDIDKVGGADARVPIVRWQEGGQLREERTHEPAALLRQLLARHQGEVPGLEVVRPTLEHVYLDILEAHGADRAEVQA